MTDALIGANRIGGHSGNHEPRVTAGIEVWAEDLPQAPAIVAPGRAPLPYGRLHEFVASVGTTLRRCGFEPDDRIALVVDNGPEAVTAFLGIASIAACAPLNPAYRPSEFEFFLNDLGAKAVVVERSATSPVRDVARSLGVEIVELERLHHAEAGLFELEVSGRAGRLHGAPGDRRAAAALMLHTSGTTSRPKLVPLTHGNLCASAQNVATTLELTSADRCLNVMPLFHIHGLVAAALATMWSGGSLVCTPGFHAERFYSWLRETSPTWYTAVPTMHQGILSRARPHKEAIEQSRLRFIRSSSAALPPRVLEELEAVFGVPVIEAYGMTEAAHQMASNPARPGRRKAGSVGCAAGPVVGVLDDEGRLLPAGSIGEVAVRGENVFNGYEANDAANESAFVHGWFRTGDQGFIDDDGYLFLRGRIKEIINRGGEKVSPAEVDEVLLDHPAVTQAVTFAIADPVLGEEVAAAIVLRNGAVAAEQELQQFVGVRLADFKIPRRLVFVDEIPKGPTGKVQRLQLAGQLGLAGVPGSVSGEPGTPRPPSSAVEAKLAALFAEVLGVPTVGVTDDFFVRGGDSILAAEVMARVNAEWVHADLPQAALVWAPTPERLAALVEEGNVPTSSLIPLQVGAGRPPFFFVHGADGEVVGFATLARGLGPEQPFYALRARGLDGPEPPHESVAAMASCYLEEIRAVQPHGPYFLGGICLGGPISIEMARSLLSDGEQVSLLALLDPRLNVKRGPRYYLLRVLIVLRQRQLRAVVGYRVWWIRRRLRRWLRPSSRSRSSPSSDGPSRAAFRRAIREARASYVARPYPGPVTVYATRDYATPRTYWRDLLPGGFEWVEISGGHTEVFRHPTVDLLARELSGKLDHAGTSSESG